MDRTPNPNKGTPKNLEAKRCITKEKQGIEWYLGATTAREPMSGKDLQTK